MRKDELYHQAEQILQEYLGMHNLRPTSERSTILRLIAAHEGKFTSTNVITWVKPLFISQATVYNTLSLLEKAHIIVCLHKQHSARVLEYEMSLGDDNTMHIVCSKCGRVARVRDKSADIALTVKKYPNFIMRRYSVYVFGECKHCTALNNKRLNA